jgi:hypothetical protein
VGRREAPFSTEADAIECASYVAAFLHGRRVAEPKPAILVQAARLLAGKDVLRAIAEARVITKPTRPSKPRRTTLPR